MHKRAEFMTDYVARQLASVVPDGYPATACIAAHAAAALERADACVAATVSWRDKGFDYLVSWHHAAFLYFLANSIWRSSGDTGVATRLFLLNKALNSIDLFYEVEMPPHFIVGHTLGMVFAKADYGDYCVFFQGCTVGRSEDDRPVLEPGAVLFPGARVIGNCRVRENSVLTPGVNLVNTDTPGNCFVFPGEKGKPVFKEIDEYYVDRYFVR